MYKAEFKPIMFKAEFKPHSLLRSLSQFYNLPMREEFMRLIKVLGLEPRSV